MIKILTAEQTRELDQYTIEKEPIDSINLMERASLAFVHWLTTHYTESQGPVYVFCGTGNNGGDGLAVARLLKERFFDVSIWLAEIAPQRSPDNATNLARAREVRSLPIHSIAEGDPFPTIPAGALVVDALFGSGLNRPVEGYWGALLQHLNAAPATRIAIDIPSGLFAHRPTEGIVFSAHHTVSFELPKLCFFVAENQHAVGNWVTRSIGLHPDFLSQVPADFYFVDPATLHRWLHIRRPFDHKGTYGHALLVMGSFGKMGAAMLSARATLRVGCGLVTVHAPKCGYEIMQMGFPEAMVSVDAHQYIFSEFLENTDHYQAVGVGCGLGTSHLTANGLKLLIEQTKRPMVLDADALNILAEHPDWLELLPPKSILTPHPKEFERLFGTTKHWYDRLQRLRTRAHDLDLILLLKGAFTCIALPSGEAYFNGSGNPGMGTGGSGDVLTGMITGLLAQGYAPERAALLGVYLHGLAGDLAAKDLDQEALLAGDIIQYIGRAFKRLKHA
jgi:hydroxyethylthiazole kinase-like uncharacterized protein yjeF